MCRQGNSQNPCGQAVEGSAFQLAAISNWGLFQSFHKTDSLEAYSDYLARLAIAGQMQEMQKSAGDTEGQREEGTAGNAESASGNQQESGQWRTPDLLIIREKELGEAAYLRLFQEVWEKAASLLWKEEGKALSRRGEGKSLPGIEKRPIIIPHTYLSAARTVGADAIHLPFALLQRYYGTGELDGIKRIGVSIHSPEEAARAQELGAAYVTAGHIFATGCKPGLAPRGLSFLEQVCACVSIPVYAIGGIHWENLPFIRQTKASGACMMSEYMHIPYVQTASNML